MKIWILIILAVSTANAQLVTQKLSWTDGKKASDGKKVITSFSQQKKMEMEKKWTECAALGKSNSASGKGGAGGLGSVKGWILTSWLHCGREVFAEKKTVESLTEALKSADFSPGLFLTGPWRPGLYAEILKARFLLIEAYEKSNPPEAWKQIEYLTEQKDRMDRSQRAKVFERAGGLAQAQAQLKAAQFFYEESLKEQENKATREKLSSILFAVAPEVSAESSLKPGEVKKVDFINEAEEKFEERIKSSMKANDLMSLMEDCIGYTQQFPSGRRSKWVNEKILDVYQSFLERQDNVEGAARMKALQMRALTLMAKADAPRMAEWARYLHRKSDFVGSLRLAEKALETFSKTSTGAILLYVAGRSAQFSGDYKKAKKYFEQYMEQHSGAEDLNEVLFRLGLVNLRLGLASSAIANFEKILTLKGNDRYELSSRYWLVRSLQATNNTRALNEVDAILAKFPFSYYGLRLNLEKSSGFLGWPTPAKVEPNLSADFFLLSSHKKILERVQLLAQNGWLQEAFSEAVDLPVPNEAVGKVLYAKKLAEWQIFPQAIRLINEAGEIDSNLRALDVVSLSLPLVYKELIESQALKQKLNPLLVRSLIRQESAFGVKAISSSSAFGLMQLIGPTAQEVASELGLRNVSIPDDVFAPEMNVQMGSYYIGKMIRQFGGNVPMGLAAYNAGPSKMQTFIHARTELRDSMSKPSSDPWDELWFDEIPWFETSFYIKAILRNAMLYKVAEKAQVTGPSVDPDQRRVEFGPVIWSDLVLQ